MSERFYLQWNIVNWITVVAMVLVGTVIFGALASGIRQYGKTVSAGDV